MPELIKDLIIKEPIKSWDILFDVRQPDAEHKNGHYVIAKETGHQWEKGDLDEKIFKIVRYSCAETDLPKFRQDVEVNEERWLLDVPYDIGEFDVVPVDEVRTKVIDGKLIKGWYKPVFYDEGNYTEVWTAIDDKIIPRLTYETVPAVQENYKIDVAAFTADKIVEKNIYAVDVKVNLVATTTEEKEETSALLDTRQNAILTVGTGKTHSTISAAITAASSGDCIEVYAGGVANVYTETVAYGAKALQVVGMVASRGITITQSSGVVVTLGTGVLLHSLIRNFTIIATGTATTALTSDNYSIGCVMDNISATGGTTACIYPQYTSIVINCLAYDGVNGFYTSSPSTIFVHCTAVDNSTSGFSGNAASRLSCILCVSAANAADYVNIASLTLCTSADATASGQGCVTGFVTTDFTDYVGDDFTLKAAVAATTTAKFAGYPEYPYDAAGQTRKTTGVVYAGWSDPDPAGAASISGTWSVAKHATQNSIIATLSSLVTNGADYFVFKVKLAATPDTVCVICPIASTTWNIYHDYLSAWIYGSVQVDVGVISNTTGVVTWLGDVKTITAAGYMLPKA